MINFLRSKIEGSSESRISMDFINRMKYEFLKTRTRKTLELKVDGISRNCFLALKNSSEGMVGHTGGGITKFYINESGKVYKQHVIKGDFKSISDIVYMESIDAYFAYDDGLNQLIKV